MRFGGTPAKLVLDAKRDLNAPLIPNANMALKNYGAHELQRFIDKRLTTLDKANREQHRAASIQAYQTAGINDDE